VPRVFSGVIGRMALAKPIDKASPRGSSMRSNSVIFMGGDQIEGLTFGRQAPVAAT
jgi:hypothetical protein